MKKQDFIRYFNSFMNRESSKQVQFSSLNREEKINYLLSQISIDVEKTYISTNKEVEISKLSKDCRFELIQKAALANDMELVQNLSLNKGTAVVAVSVQFEKATIQAQLDYLTKIYIEQNGSLPENVEVDILGGVNFEAWIDFCYAELHK